MQIGFIGAGKVATTFGRYLHDRGLSISGYYDRHDEKAATASEVTQSQSYPRAAAVVADSDIILITTRDDQIAGACEDLCRQPGISTRHLVGHMSGAHSSRILDKAGQRGAALFSLHPLQAFADADKALADLPHTYFSLESTGERLQPVKDMLAQMGNRYFSISPEHKSLYHISACILSNYLVTLMASGLTTLAHSGIDPREGFQAMRPLIECTLSNIARLGPAKALTGPIARGDVGTVDHHLQALRTWGLEDIESLYRHLGLQTLELAHQSALSSPEKAAAVRQLLERT
jgi:predicted short-subunit dehydrogenase-like oxidoreductase (DUF2520 family)